MFSNFASRSSRPFLLHRLGDLLHDLPAGAGDVGQRRQDPDRRGAESDQASQFEPMARGAPQQEISGQLAFGRIHALNLAHLLDHETQRDLDHGLISFGATDSGGNRHAAHLPHQPAGQSGAGTHQPFGQRKQVNTDSRARLSRGACGWASSFVVHGSLLVSRATARYNLPRRMADIVIRPSMKFIKAGYALALLVVGVGGVHSLQISGGQVSRRPLVADGVLLLLLWPHQTAHPAANR